MLYLFSDCICQTDMVTGQRLLNEVEKALETLSEYTSRMKQEEKERQEVDEHLDTFIWHQQRQLYDAKMKQNVI